MKKYNSLFLLFLCFLNYNLAHADTVQILSPDVQQSFAYGSVTSTYLEWDADQKTLTAVVNYSNTPYTQNPNNIDSDELTFKIPDVTYDPASGLYSVKNPKGVSIAIAKRNPTTQLTRQVMPLPSTRIVLDNMGGTFMLFVNACNKGEFRNEGVPWVERTHGFRLGNTISNETAVP